MELYLAIAIIETRRDESSSVSTAGFRLRPDPKSTEEDAGSWRMFQHRILEIRIKRWRQLDTNRKGQAAVGDVYQTIETSAFEFRIQYQGAF
jgi:hypothetical protein